MFSDPHKIINTLCGQNVELSNVKLVVHIVTTGQYSTDNCKNLQEQNSETLHTFKLTVLWVVTLCIVFDNYGRFRGAFSVYLQGIRWKQLVPLKHWQIPNTINSTTTRKTVIFTITAMRTSDLAFQT